MVAKKWITCGSCDIEFSVISDTFYKVEYCPYCSEPIEDSEEEEEDDS